MYVWVAGGHEERASTKGVRGGGSPLARRRLQSRMVSWSRKRRETQDSPSASGQEGCASAGGERTVNRGGDNGDLVTQESLKWGARAEHPPK